MKKTFSGFSERKESQDVKRKTRRTTKQDGVKERKSSSQETERG